MAATFEAEFSKIENLVGVAGDELEDLRKGTLALSGAVAKGPNELAKALFTVTSAGARGAQAMSILEQAAKASAIGLGDTEEVARTVTAATTAYAKAGLTAAEATDILAATVRAGNLDAASLAGVLGKVIGIASAVGVSFDQVGAAIATYTRQGVDAAQATNDLAAFLRAIARPSRMAISMAKEMGFSFKDLQRTLREDGLLAAMQQMVEATDGDTESLGRLIGSAEALRLVLGTVSTQAEAFGKIADEVADSTGLVDKGFENASKTAEFRFKQALADVQAAGIELGAELLPIVTKIADTVSSAAKAFSSLDESVQGFIVTSGIFVAAIGPMLSGIAKLTQAVIAIKAALGGMVTVVAGLGAALVGYLVYGFNSVTTAGEGATAVVGEYADEIDRAREAIRQFNEQGPPKLGFGQHARDVLSEEEVAAIQGFLDREGLTVPVTPEVEIPPGAQPQNLQSPDFIVALRTDPLLEGLREVQQVATDLTPTLRDVGEATFPPAVTERVALINAHLRQARETLANWDIKAMIGMSDVIGRAVGDLVTLQDSFKDFTQNIIQGFQRILSSIIAQIVKQKILNALAKEELATKQATAAVSSAGGGGGFFGGGIGPLALVTAGLAVAQGILAPDPPNPGLAYTSPGGGDTRLTSTILRNGDIRFAVDESRAKLQRTR